ncbi:MAG: SOS response-associated peptidase family protein [Bdellovibrionota bacterium]
MTFHDLLSILLRKYFMCAQFQLKITANQLAKKFGIRLPEKVGDFDEIFLPYRQAPVVVLDDKSLNLKAMNFSLVPAWSKEPKVRFATHNARLYSFDEKTNKEVAIYEKPTWRDPFKKKHCLVPMTGFIEAIYTQSLAGNMVEFFSKEENLLVAAGIWEEWLNKKTGEVLESFSILTHEPYAFVDKMGHDRSPVFLDESKYRGWLEVDSKSPVEMLDFLRSSRSEPCFDVAIVRPLKAGWQKRLS